MISIVYVSSATRPMDEEELLGLLRKSRENNVQLGLSGMLLYKGGNFMQVLEGPEETADALCNKIERDPRHRGFLCLLRRTIAEREFDSWSMGFQNVDRLAAAEIDGYSPLLRESFTSPAFGREPGAALKLLLSFKKIQR